MKTIPYLVYVYLREDQPYCYRSLADSLDSLPPGPRSQRQRLDIGYICPRKLVNPS